MKAIILTIGDEILLGQILDTNSRYMAAELARLGIDTVRMESISDTPQAIRGAVQHALQEAQLVLLTGGLGPTKDDVTKKTLAEYFGNKLVFSQQVYEWVDAFLSHYPGHPMNEYNKSQAYLPDGCVALQNRRGTASGMWFEQDGKILVSLPGVPFEMEYLMQAEVLPRLTKRLGPDCVRYKMLTVFNIPEAELAMSLRTFEDTLPPTVGLAYLPSPGFVRLRLTAKGTDSQTLLQTHWAELKKALSDKKFTETTAQPENYFVQELAQLGVTVATAESCTGGNIAHLITALPGASAYFLGGIVSYANEVKQQVLGVSADDLEKYGAVSEPVAKQMAQGARRATGAQWAVSTTGIAGPDGGTAEKPVGTVWIGVAGPQGAKAQQFHFSATRERNIAKASFKAIEWLVEEIKKSR